MNRALLAALVVSVSLAAQSPDVAYQENVTVSSRGDVLPGLFDPLSHIESSFDSAGYAPEPPDSPHTSTVHVYIKGGKLLRVADLSWELYDLEQGKVTYADPAKRTYHVYPFSEMKRKLDKGPKCGGDCTVTVEETGRTMKINGDETNEYRLGAFIGSGDTAQYLSHASYWVAPSLPSEAMTNFAKKCIEKFAPQYADVCALTWPRAFSTVAAATDRVKGYVVARSIETRTRAAGRLEPRNGFDQDRDHKPWDVRTGATPAQVTFTETRISHVVEGTLSEDLFQIPAGYRKRSSN